MVEEQVSQFAFEEFLGAETSRQLQVQQTKEDKKLKRSNRWFIFSGLAALATGAAIFMESIGILPGFLADWLPPIIVAGVTTTVFSLIGLWRTVRRKALSFPSLTIRRKTPAVSVPDKLTYKSNRLSKSGNNKVFMGVAGGIAEYSGLSPTLIRLGLIVAFFFSAGFISIAYLGLGFFLPESIRSVGTRQSVEKNSTHQINVW